MIGKEFEATWQWLSEIESQVAACLPEFPLWFCEENRHPRTLFIKSHDSLRAPFSQDALAVTQSNRLRYALLGHSITEHFQCRELLTMAATHPIGHVRQAVLERLIEDALGDELPILIARLKDNVPILRTMALTACDRRLGPRFAEIFIANLPFLTNLFRSGSPSMKTFVEAAYEMLTKPPAVSSLLASLISPPYFAWYPRRLVPRECARLALGRLPNEESVYRQAFRGHDSQIQRMAAQKLMTLEVGHPLVARIAPYLAKGHFPALRREYLLLCHRHSLEDSSRALRAGLMDAHASVREVARTLLPNYGKIDLTDFYRRHCSWSDDRQLCVALAGLGETGDRDNRAIVRRYLSHRNPKVRIAAAYAIVRLLGEAGAEDLAPLLTDSSKKVAMIARQLLARYDYTREKWSDF